MFYIDPLPTPFPVYMNRIILLKKRKCLFNLKFYFLFQRRNLFSISEFIFRGKFFFFTQMEEKKIKIILIERTQHCFINNFQTARRISSLPVPGIQPPRHCFYNFQTAQKSCSIPITGIQPPVTVFVLDQCLEGRPLFPPEAEEDEPPFLSLVFFRFLRTHLGQYQSVFSAGSEVMPTQSQWYQSSHLSQPIIGVPSSCRLHVGQIQTWNKSLTIV
jgi:hypothetical protein